MNDDRLHSRRMTMMATAIEIMVVMNREGHTVRSALADLGAAPRPGRGATWEDVTRRIVALMEADERGVDLLERWRRDIAPEGLSCAPGRDGPAADRPVVVRLPAPGKARPPKQIQRAQKLDGPVTIEEPTAARRMVRR